LKNVDKSYFIIAKSVEEELKNAMRGNAKW
jgi:hypothetical protein